MMGLSYLFTSVAHFVLEKLWPRPSCALLTSSSSTSIITHKQNIRLIRFEITENSMISEQLNNTYFS